MVLLEAPSTGAALPRASWEFDAEVGILTHSTTIAPRYQVGAGRAAHRDGGGKGAGMGESRER
jgi:GTPase